MLPRLCGTVSILTTRPSQGSHLGFGSRSGPFRPLSALGKMDDIPQALRRRRARCPRLPPPPSLRYRLAGIRG